ncbi:hypothetical protein OA083_01155 [Candidatus Marinimicrobia bacterium]|nr:hypothetical protein [Candidatus Neomarinimicrobiota bacterium]
MIKKLNLTALLIMLMLINQLFAQSDKILLHGSCNVDEANKLSEYLKNTSNIDLAFEKKDEANLIFSNYAIIFLCGNSYLKLSDAQIQELNKMILNGSLLLIDNYRSDYTLSIFLKKLLAEYPEKNNSISEVLKNNPYRINFEQLQFNTKQVFISEKLRVLALKDESIFESVLNDDNNLRLGSGIIFNYLIGN